MGSYFWLYREVCVQKTGQNTNQDPASIIWGMVPTTVATTRFMMLLEMDSLCTVIWRLNLVQHGLLSYLGALRIRISRALGKMPLLSPSEKHGEFQSTFWLAYFRDSGKRFFFISVIFYFFLFVNLVKNLPPPPPLQCFFFNLLITWCVPENTCARKVSIELRFSRHFCQDLTGIVLQTRRWNYFCCLIFVWCIKRTRTPNSDRSRNNQNFLSTIQLPTEIGM